MLPVEVLVISGWCEVLGPKDHRLGMTYEVQVPMMAIEMQSMQLKRLEDLSDTIRPCHSGNPIGEHFHRQFMILVEVHCKKTSAQSLLG